MKIGLNEDSFKNITTEDLIKAKRSASSSFGLLLVVLIFLFATTIFQTLNKVNNALIVISIALLTLLIKKYNIVRALNKELKSRK